jgi:hypothetical protein
MTFQVDDVVALDGTFGIVVKVVKENFIGGYQIFGIEFKDGSAATFMEVNEDEFLKVGILTGPPVKIRRATWEETLQHLRDKVYYLEGRVQKENRRIEEYRTKIQKMNY